MNVTNMGGFFSQGNGNHTAISGGRKPTADSTAQSMFKANRGKFSNGGGSIGGGQDFGLDGGFNGINGKLITINKQQ